MKGAAAGMDAVHGETPELHVPQVARHVEGGDVGRGHGVTLALHEAEELADLLELVLYGRFGGPLDAVVLYVHGEEFR